MALRYWVGGTNTWDATAGTKWATTSGGAGGAAVPTSADDVFFDANSGSGTVTLAASYSAVAKTVNCTGFTGTLTSANTTGSLSVAGNLTLSSGMTCTIGNNVNITATSTIISAGKTITTYIFQIDSVSATVTLGDALNVGTLKFNSGTFTTSASNYSITCGVLNVTSFLNSARTVNFNASTVTATFITGVATNLTFNAGTSTVVLGGSGVIDVTLSFYNFTISGGSGTYCSMRAAFTVTNIMTVNSPSTDGVATVELRASLTIGTLVANGSSAVRRIFFRSYLRGTAYTLTVTTYTTKSDVDFYYVTAAGTSAPWSGTRIGNAGGNTSITGAVAKTVYWNLAGSQNWSSVGWATSSGGSPSVNNFPLPQDTAVFDDAGSADTITFDSLWPIGTISAGSRTVAMTLSTASAIGIFGNLTMSSAITITGALTISSWGTSTQTITSNGCVFPWAMRFLSTVQLGSDFVTTSTISVADSVGNVGNFNAVSYNLTAFSVTSSASATISLGSGLLTLTGTGVVFNANAGTVNINTANILLSDNTTTSRTFRGGGKIYNKLTIGGDTSTSTTTIEGSNTFSELASTKTVAHTVTFTSGTTQTVSAFTISGSPGNVVTINSSTAGSAATLSKASGTVTVDYASIRDSTATGGATWYATNSTNVSNNTGWKFITASTGFFMFFT